MKHLKWGAICAGSLLLSNKVNSYQYHPTIKPTHLVAQLYLEEASQPILFDQPRAAEHIMVGHTYAKFIKIQKTFLQKIHGLHELGSHMECNNTLHGSELGPHWVVGLGRG